MLTERDRLNEYLMTHLRTAEGISFREMGEQFGPEAVVRIEKEAEPLLLQRLLSSTPEGLKIPAERFLLSDHLIGMLFEPEP